ncbi:hypothetical protein BKA83DRAFT_1141269 [Pisolithus microcarpus]|nr:hypothetical protein BKA83DRAFT_1141269 [Pisolithus microcarpus]
MSSTQICVIHDAFRTLFVEQPNIWHWNLFSGTERTTYLEAISSCIRLMSGFLVHRTKYTMMAQPCEQYQYSTGSNDQIPMESTWLGLVMHPVFDEIVFDTANCDLCCLPMSLYTWQWGSPTITAQVMPILAGVPHDSDPR